MSGFKLVLVGDGGLGKSCLAKILMGTKFEERYVPTLGVEVHPITFGNVVFNTWDCAGVENYRGLRDGYWVLTDVAIIFHNVNEDSLNWERDLHRMEIGKDKIIHVMSKSDLLTDEQKEFYKNKGYILISSKSGEGIPDLKKRLLSLTTTSRVQ